MRRSTSPYARSTSNHNQRDTAALPPQQVDTQPLNADARNRHHITPPNPAISVSVGSIMRLPSQKYMEDFPRALMADSSRSAPR